MSDENSKKKREPVIKIASVVPSGTKRVITIPMNELEMEFFGIKYKPGKQKSRTSGKPVVSMHVDGYTILLEGEKRVGEFLKSVSRAADDFKVSKKPGKKGKQPGVYYWLDEFDNVDSQKNFNKFSSLVIGGGADFINLEFYTNDSGTANLRKAVGLKKQTINVEDIKTLVIKAVPNTFVDKDRIVLKASGIRMPKSNKTVPISCGYKVDEDGESVTLTPYILVGDKEYEYETRNIYPTLSWKGDTAREILKDANFIVDMTERLFINSRVPLKINDKGDIDQIERTLKYTIAQSEVKIPKRVAEELVTSFRNGAINKCFNGALNQSELCIDVAVLDAYEKVGILPSFFDDGVRKTIVRFLSMKRFVKKE
jgi:hypothetical protein